MKNLIAISLVALSLNACTTLQNISDGIAAATAGIDNPVTPQMLSAVENGAIVVFAGLNAYKRDCLGQILPRSCVTVIRTIQPYTRKLPPLLISLRKFVKNNDQVNAIIAYNTIKQMITDIKTTAVASHIQVQ